MKSWWRDKGKRRAAAGNASNLLKKRGLYCIVHGSGHFKVVHMPQSRSRRAWERWKVIAKKIGAFQSRVILTLFYVLIVPVFALIVKLFKDPLHLRSHKGESYWIERKTPHPDESTARRQF